MSAPTGFPPSTTITTKTQFLDAYDAIDVIGNGSFGIIRKVRRKEDGQVRWAGLSKSHELNNTSLSRFTREKS